MHDKVNEIVPVVAARTGAVSRPLKASKTCN